ncbi:MAG: isochorismatase family cysteine hydrolase [Candidatus Hydrothermarchaeales archaeon]
MRALLVIDMLKDFVEEDGSLPVPDAKKLIEPINKVLQEFRENREPVIFVCDSHDEDDREFKAWPKHAVTGTKGAEIIEELDKREEDVVVKKKRYSAFYNTDLEEILKDRSVDTLVLTGVLTDICVLHTATDAAMRNYKVVVLKDCVASVNEERHECALMHMQDVLIEAEIR